MTAPACAALGVSRATVHRRRTRPDPLAAVPKPRRRPVRGLSDAQQRVVLDLLHEPRFADQAPAEIYATLLDEGVYHCSIRTMYRILDANGEVRERRDQLRQGRQPVSCSQGHGSGSAARWLAPPLDRSM